MRGCVCKRFDLFLAASSINQRFFLATPTPAAPSISLQNSPLPRTAVTRRVGARVLSLETPTDDGVIQGCVRAHTQGALLQGLIFIYLPRTHLCFRRACNSHQSRCAGAMIRSEHGITSAAGRVSEREKSENSLSLLELLHCFCCGDDDDDDEDD